MFFIFSDFERFSLLILMLFKNFNDLFLKIFFLFEIKFDDDDFNKEPNKNFLFCRKFLEIIKFLLFLLLFLLFLLEIN